MARTRRIKSENDAFYHVMSRITGKRFLLKDERVKQIMLDSLRRSAAFSGVKVGAYIIMDNHFHLAVEVPTLETVLEELDLGKYPPNVVRDEQRKWKAERSESRVPNGKLPEKEVLRRIAILKGDKEAEGIAAYVDYLRNKGQVDEAEEELDRYRRRMQDLSQFVKTFKEVFNFRFKKLFKYSGSIWGERFKSTLIENAEYFLKCRDYIELNAKRAKIVEKKEDYRWSSIGGAARGERFAISCVNYSKSLILGLDDGGDSPREAGDIAAERSEGRATREESQAKRDSPATKSSGCLSAKREPEGPQGAEPSPLESAKIDEEEFMKRVPQVGLGKILGGKEFVGRLGEMFKDQLYGQNYKPRKVGSWAYSSHGHRSAA